jgi:hypothetical protein
MRIGRALVVAAFLLMMSHVASAQAVNSNVAHVNLSFSQTETITVSTDVNAISFNAAGAASAPINVTTTYNLSSSRTKLAVAAFFSSGSALSGSAGSIPTSQIMATTPTGSGTCDGSLGNPDGSNVTNACPWVFSTSSLSPTQGSRTDAVTLSIQNVTTVAPGSYSGIINFSAQSL